MSDIPYIELKGWHCAMSANMEMTPSLWPVHAGNLTNLMFSFNDNAAVADQTLAVMSII